MKVKRHVFFVLLWEKTPVKDKRNIPLCYFWAKTNYSFAYPGVFCYSEAGRRSAEPKERRFCLSRGPTFILIVLRLGNDEKKCHYFKIAHFLSFSIYRE